MKAGKGDASPGLMSAVQKAVLRVLPGNTATVMAAKDMRLGFVPA